MKKAISIVLTIALILSLGTIALAAKDPVPAVELWKDGFGFHCNNGNGNGKVVTGAEKDWIELKNAGGTAYELVTSAANAIVCPKCERIDWVTYSNNSGKISGKNIQTQHSGTPVYLAEASATLTLIDTIVSDCPEVETGSTVVGTEKQSGLYKTSETATFTFEIPAGYEIIEGTNPVVITFEPIAGQNLSGAVVAEKIIVVDCECEEDDDGTADLTPECEHEWICSNCWTGNGGLCKINNAHKVCETTNAYHCSKCKESTNLNKTPDATCNCGNQDPNFVDDDEEGKDKKEAPGQVKKSDEEIEVVEEVIEEAVEIEVVEEEDEDEE